MVEALYSTWQLTKNYSLDTPVVEAEEFGATVGRIGLGG